MIKTTETSGTAGAGGPSAGSPPCLSDLAFDRLVGGELAASATRAAEHHLDRCPRCRERLDARKAEAQAFATLAPPLPERPPAPAPPPPRDRRRWRAAGAGGALAAAAVAGWLLQVRPAGGPVPGAERSKGSAALAYFS
jgi:anti-sigma factor RsiW